MSTRRSGQGNGIPVNRQEELFRLGVERCELFARKNKIELCPIIRATGKEEVLRYWVASQENPRKAARCEGWYLVEGNWDAANRYAVLPPAIYVLPHLARPLAGEAVSKNWHWPGSTIDFTAYGVVAHEVGHWIEHCMDIALGSEDEIWDGRYGKGIMQEAREDAITTYGSKKDEDWFAEAMRLYILNPDLLRRCRPRTYARLSGSFAN